MKNLEFTKLLFAFEAFWGVLDRSGGGLAREGSLPKRFPGSLREVWVGRLPAAIMYE